MDPEKRTWLTEMSGIAVLQEATEEKRKQKDLLAEQMSTKVGLAKDEIRSELTMKFKKRRGFGSIKTLDDSGTQIDEFDISDYDKYQVEQRDIVQMSAAWRKVERIATEMREAKTEKINPLTGEKELDSEGKPILVPLYTDEEIAEEVYMPLVRERIIPESLIPGRYSKTQEMITASDKLYKARLEQYTQETESDPEFSEDVKIFGEKMLDVASQAAKMFPEGGEMASTAIQLAKVGFVTGVTAYQLLGRDEWQGMATQVIDGIGKVASGIVSAAVSPDVGKLVQTSYNVGATLPKCMIHLCGGDEPDISGFCGALADGLGDAMGLAMPGANDFQKAVIQAACNSLRNAGTGVNIARAAQDGDKQKVIAGLGQIAQNLLKDATQIAKGAGGGDVSPEKLEEIESKLSSSLTALEQSAQLTVTIVDAVKTKNIQAMVQNIVDQFGGILATTTGAFAPPEVAKQVGSAYAASTSIGLVAYYLTLEEPDQASAMKALAKGFGGAMQLACPGDESTARKIGGFIEKGITQAGNAIDLGKLIREEKYSEAVKKAKSIAQTIISTAFGEVPSSSDLSEEELEKIQQAVEGGLEGTSDLVGEIAKLKETLNAEEAKEALEAAVMELRGQQALSELKDAQDEVRNLLVQRDESGKSAAAERSIDNLIKQMIKDRMMMELATKLASGGVSTVAKFVPVLGTADAAIQLATNLMKAADRAVELNKWIGNQKDMQSAQSAFSSSAQNFVKNQAEQFSYYTIQAALKLAQLIGEVVKCSGLASAAGEGLSKASALASVAAEAIRDFAKKADLEKSWKMTKRAWEHPESRKLQLIARKMNPTLAKYTLAWGAVEKHDAMAMEAMATCGLNELTLSDEGSNVDKVQQYLEVMFNEDNVVLKRVVTPDWAPDTIELTVRCWNVAKAKCIKDAKLKDEPTGRIDETVAAVERTTKQVDGKFQEVESAKGQIKNQLMVELQDFREQLIDSLTELKNALEGWSPKNADNNLIHREMKDFVEQVYDHAALQLLEVQGSYDETDSLLSYVSMQRLLN